MAGDCDRIALVHALADLAGRQVSDIEVVFVLEHAKALPPTGSISYPTDLNSFAVSRGAGARSSPGVATPGRGLGVW